MFRQSTVIKDDEKEIADKGVFDESKRDLELRETLEGFNPRTQTTEAFQDIVQEGMSRVPTQGLRLEEEYRDRDTVSRTSVGEKPTKIDPGPSQYDTGRSFLAAPEMGEGSGFEGVTSDGRSIQEQDLVLPQFYPIVRDFMKAKSGDLDWEYKFVKQNLYGGKTSKMIRVKRDPAEVVDQFVEYWRGVASGNSIALGKHVLNVWNASGDQEKAEIFLAAEELRDSMGKFGGKGFTPTSMMQKYQQRVEGVYDYAFYVLADPVNAVSLGMYPIIARTLGRKGAKKVLEKTINRNLKTIGATKGLSEAQKRQKANLMTQRALRNYLAGGYIRGRASRATLLKGITDNAHKKAIFSTGAWDSGAAVTVDSLYQLSRQMLDEEYDWSQASTVLNFAVGGAPAWIGGYFARLSQLKKIDNIAARKEEAAIHGDIFNYVLEKMHAAKVQSQNRTIPTDLENVDMNGFLDNLRENVTKQTSLKEKSEAAALKLSRETNTPLGEPEQSDMMRLFLFGNEEEGVEGLTGLFSKWGIEWEGKRTNLVDANGNKIKDGITNWYIDTINILPKELRAEINKLYEGSLKRSNGFSDVNMDEGFRMMGAKFSEGGGYLNIASMLESQTALKGAWLDPDTPVSKIIDQEIQPPTGSVVNKIIRGAYGGLGHGQTQYIKGLVAHPRTSWLNTIGYGGMSLFNSASDIFSLTFNSVVHGGKQSANHLLGVNMAVDADWWSKTRKLALNATVNRAKNLGNMGESIDIMMDTFTRFPKELDSLVSVMTGGTPLEAADMARYLDLPEIQKLKGSDPRTWLRNAMEKAQLISGARAVDMATKSQAFLYHVDKRMIKKYNMTYLDLLSSDTVALKPNEGPQDVISIINSAEFGAELTGAADDAAREVLGKSYGYGAGKQSPLTNRPIKARLESIAAKREAGESILSDRDFFDPIIAIADLVENARRIPIVGTMLPFGRFANGVIALSMDMLGMSMIYNLTRRSMGAKSRDLSEIAPKTATAWIAAWAMSGQEMEDINRGLALNQRMDSGGNISDVTYSYPYIAFKALARGMAYIRMGEIPTFEYYEQTGKLLGAGVTRGLAGGYQGIVDFLYDGSTQDNPEAFKEAVNKVGGMFGNLFQGYSRVLSPLNDAIKLAQGPDYYSPDRNLAERKKLSQTFRYVDEIFNLMGIYEKDPQRKFVATDYDEFAFSSPVPFLLGQEANVSYVEQIMNQIGVPKFKLTQDAAKYGAVVKSDIDRLMSTEVNRLAEKLWKSPQYQDASLRDKRNLFNTLRADAKSIVLDRIANMDTSEEFNTSEQIWRKNQVKALKEIKGKYGDNTIKRRVSELEFTNPFLEVPKFDNPKDLEAWVKENRVTDIEDMSADQIEAIISYMELMNDKLKADYKKATE